MSVSLTLAFATNKYPDPSGVAEPECLSWSQSVYCRLRTLQGYTPPCVHTKTAAALVLCPAPHGKMVTTRRKSIMEILFTFNCFTPQMTRDSFLHGPKASSRCLTSVTLPGMLRTMGAHVKEIRPSVCWH